jgi:hypothetical protein
MLVVDVIPDTLDQPKLVVQIPLEFKEVYKFEDCGCASDVKQSCIEV